MTASPEEKVKIVQQNVQEVYSFIDEIKQQELEEARKKALRERYLMQQQQQQQQCFGSAQPQAYGFGGRGGGGGGRGGGGDAKGGRRSFVSPLKVKSAKPHAIPAKRERKRAGRVFSPLLLLLLFYFVADPSSSVAAQIISTEELSPSAEIPQEKNVETSKTESSSSASQQKKITSSSALAFIDYTQIPSQIEKVFHQYDPSGSVRPTIINIGKIWKKETRQSILAPFVTKFLANDEQLKAKNEAFQLLDCLTKSGSICVTHCQFHILISSTHCYNDTLLNSVIQHNSNPIEEIERSSLIIASIIHQERSWNMINESEKERFSQRYSLGRYHPQAQAVTVAGIPSPLEMNSMKLLPAGEYFELMNQQIQNEREEEEEEI
jgi:hypothetical protein